MQQKFIKLAGLAITASLLISMASFPILETKAQPAVNDNLMEKNYLLYGYNAIQGGFINTTNTGSKPILSQSETEINNANSTSYGSTSYTNSSSIRKIYESFSASFSGSYSGVAFSGKVNTEFSTTKNINENRQYMRHTSYFYDKDISNNIAVSNLSNYLSPNFLKDIESLSATEILSVYGTHLIMQYYTGGRLDVNYSYTNLDTKTDSEIKASVEATYAEISSTATADDKRKAQLVETHASLTSESCGGPTEFQVSGTSITSIGQQFSEWQKHLDEKPDICGVKDGALLGIWELFPKDSPVYTALYNEYKNELAKKEAGLNDLDGGPITDITVLVGNTKEEAIAKLPPDYYIALSLNPGGDCKYLDANHHGGGQYIYIAYTYQDVMDINKNKLHPIVNFTIKEGRDTSVNGFTKIPIDLNKSQGKNTPYIYLFYCRANDDQYSKKDTLYVSRICGYYGDDYVLPANWFTPDDSIQLNKGVKAKEGGNDCVTLAYQNTYRDTYNLAASHGTVPVVAASELLKAEPDDKDDTSQNADNATKPNNPGTGADRDVLYVSVLVILLSSAVVSLSRRLMFPRKRL